MRSDTTSTLDRRVRELEVRLGKRILLRAVRCPERNFRGQITSIPGAVMLEYRDETAGYFWDCDIVRELLDHLAVGGGEIVLFCDTPLTADNMSVRAWSGGRVRSSPVRTVVGTD